jgi:hypothetical protein
VIAIPCRVSLVYKHLDQRVVNVFYKTFRRPDITWGGIGIKYQGARDEKNREEGARGNKNQASGSWRHQESGRNIYISFGFSITDNVAFERLLLVIF